MILIARDGAIYLTCKRVFFTTLLIARALDFFKIVFLESLFAMKQLSNDEKTNPYNFTGRHDPLSKLKGSFEPTSKPV